MLLWFSVIQLLIIVHSTSVVHTVCLNESSGTDLGNTKDQRNCQCNQSDVIRDELFVDNSVVTFCKVVVLQHPVIHVNNKKNISLCGLSSSHTEIHCHGNNSGFNFTNVTDLTLSYISFINCGNMNHNTTGATPLSSGVWFYYCRDVRLSNITIRSSPGTGATFINTHGYLEIKDSIFANNNINSFSYGGGVYVEYTSDQHNYLNDYKNMGDCKIVFINNTFTNNNASSVDNNSESSVNKQQQADHQPYTSDKTIKELGWGGGLTLHFEDDADASRCTEKFITIAHCKFIGNTANHGGGMSLYLTGNTNRNTVTIKHCNFTYNKANLGGGLSMIFVHNPQNNSVLVIHTNFIENHAEDGGGGGMEIGFHFEHNTPETNRISFKHCKIEANCAQYGGGTTLHYSKTKTAIQSNEINFISCSWKENKALFGSAVELSPPACDTFTSGYVLSPTFVKCQFLSNSRLKRVFKEEHSASYSWGRGVFLITAFPIMFKGETLFIDSNTSALSASSSVIGFAAGSNVTFINNIGYEGGAINLVGLSALHVRDNSTFSFINNTSISKGGAIMYRSNNKLDFVSSKSCFIQYIGNTSIVSERSITITFDGNRAQSHNGKSYGHTIFAVSYTHLTLPTIYSV